MAKRASVYTAIINPLLPVLEQQEKMKGGREKKRRQSVKERERVKNEGQQE